MEIKSAGLDRCAKDLGNGVAPPLECLEKVVVSVISIAFAFLGAACILFILFAAVKFITSGGDPKAVKSARDMMTYAIIGTIIVVMVFVIANILAGFFAVPGFDLFNFKIKLS